MRKNSEDAPLTQLVRSTFLESDPTCTVVRVARDLGKWSERCGGQRTGRLTRPAPRKRRTAARAQYPAECSELAFRMPTGRKWLTQQSSPTCNALLMNKRDKESRRERRLRFL